LFQMGSRIEAFQLCIGGQRSHGVALGLGLSLGTPICIVICIVL
jgi:hypothetical protein